MKAIKENIWMIIYLLICAICIIDFWMGGADDDGAPGFAILWFYIIIPVASFVASFMYGKKKKKTKWLFILLCAVMGVVLDWVTFLLANTLVFGHINMPEFSDAVGTGFPALIGMFISHVIWYSGTDVEPHDEGAA